MKSKLLLFLLSLGNFTPLPALSPEGQTDENITIETEAGEQYTCREVDERLDCQKNPTSFALERTLFSP